MSLEPVTTGDDGVFAFSDVAQGGYRLEASLNGYVPFAEDVTVAAGEETVVAVTLLRYQIAVTGDYHGQLTRLLEGKGYRVESTTAAAIADRPGDYAAIVANGAQDDPGDETFRRLLANADEAGVSIVFLDTWGISYGSLHHLFKYTGDPAVVGSNYNDGEVSLIARGAHPLTAGLPVGQRVEMLAPQTEYAWFDGYSGRSLADVYIGELGRVAGAGIGFEARSFGSAHVLLSLHAVSPWSGPETSWTPAARTVFDNAVDYALEASFGAAAGTVADTSGAPLAAKVTVAETGESTTAAADGTYRLLLPSGSHTLRFERIGSTPQEHAVVIADGATRSLDVTLASSGAGGIAGTVTSTSCSSNG